jgi:steroid delta-isomerase-like uncharacterized protein
MSIPDVMGSPGHAPAAESRATRAVIDGIFAAAATGVLEDVLGWWADDGVLDDITLSRIFNGKAELRPYLDWYFKALPDLDFRPARILVDGPYAAVEWAETCHMSGPFDGLVPDGRELQLRALDLFEIRNGLVQHESSWYGDSWFRRRIGSIGADAPSPPPPPLPRGASWAEPVVPDQRPAGSSADTRLVVEGLFAAAATGQTEDVLAWWADDGVLDDVTLARRVAGKAELRRYLDMYYRALPDLDFKPKLLIVDGPWALVEWAETCHLSAPFDGVPADGRELRLRAVDLFEVREGLVAHESGWYGDGYLRDRLELADPSRLPEPIPRGSSW